MNNNARITQLLRMLESDTADPFLYYALALEYAKEGHHSEAIHYYEKLIHMFPDYEATYLQYGNLLMELRRIEEAKAIYNKGLKVINNHNSKAFLELSEALSLLEE